MAIFCIRLKDFSWLRAGDRGSESNLGKAFAPSLPSPVPPPLGGPDQAEGNHAEPEVDNEAEVDLEKLVPSRRWQGWHQHVVGCVAQQHRQERLHEVRDHRWFRHRRGLVWHPKFAPVGMSALTGSLLPFCSNPHSCWNSPPRSSTSRESVRVWPRCWPAKAFARCRISFIICRFGMKTGSTLGVSPSSSRAKWRLLSLRSARQVCSAPDACLSFR